MLKSGIESVQSPISALGAASAKISSAGADGKWLIRSLAIIQVLLGAMAITNYHVQIITRISSAYPLLYLWLAGKLAEVKTSQFGGNVVVFMVMYAMIQGVLFASFLPPA